jgi:branched-chain amino acid transport system ATP-binding protein
MSNTALLDVQGLRVAYGGINAVKGIDLHVAAGELVALIGANGAGKTSALKAIAGVLAPAAGRIIYGGQDVTQQPSFRLVQQGLALVPEGRGIFPQLTVAENLQMGAYCRPNDASVAQDLERVYGLFQRLFERRSQKAGTLSGGEQQMLAIGRALMSRPKLLLLDEPSMGLAPMMVQKIFETVVQIAREGVTTLLVEQNARVALQISQRAYVLDSGAITLQGEARQLLNDAKVREAYLGE